MREARDAMQTWSVMNAQGLKREDGDVANQRRDDRHV